MSNMNRILPFWIFALLSLARACQAASDLDNGHHHFNNKYGRQLMPENEHSRLLNYEQLQQRHQLLNQNGNRQRIGEQMQPSEPTVRRTFVPPGRDKTNCTSCLDRELYLNFTKEEIRKEILRKLDLKEPPNVSVDAVPKHLIKQLLDRYRHDLEDSVNIMNDDPNFNGHLASYEDDDYHFQTRQINMLAINPTQILPSLVTRRWDIQYFNLDTPQLRDETWRNVHKARIYIHLPQSPSPNDKDVFVDTFLIGIDKHGLEFKKRYRTTKADLLQDRGGWLSLDATDIVQTWLRNPQDNYGLELVAKTATGTRLPLGVQHQSAEGNAPFLQLEIRDNAYSGRRKRTLSKICNANDDEEDGSNEGHCCLWPFTVDFEKEFGWKFIIFPPSYEANYCSGDCSLGKMMPENPYGHILQQSNISPCCTPQKMSAISLLYLDENNNVILGKLPKMKVDRCGCA